MILSMVSAIDLRERVTATRGLWLRCMRGLTPAVSTALLLTFEEHKKGAIELGKWADIAVFDGDLLTVPDDRMQDLPIRLTIVGGRIAHHSAPAYAR
jgi:predicted amidohydrolase YtcJ